jgi:hypothetical protein
VRYSPNGEACLAKRSLLRRALRSDDAASAFPPASGPWRPCRPARRLGCYRAKDQQVQPTLVITGHGGIRLSTGRQVGCGTTSCRRTISVPARKRLSLTAQAARFWRLGRWTGACRGTTAICKLRLTRSATASFKFIRPGERENPLPIGTTFAISDGWRFRVVSDTIDATAQITAIPGNKPPPWGRSTRCSTFLPPTQAGGQSSFQW